MAIVFNDYQDILFTTNFVGGAGQNDLSTVSGELDQRADIGIDGNGDYQFFYYALTSTSDLNALGYYTSGVDREYTQLPSGGPSLSANQSSILTSVLNSSTWGVSFADVAKIDLNIGTTNTADIVIGATTNGGTPSIGSTTGGYEYDYSTGSSALKHGDVWLNNDADLGGGSLWNDTTLGRYGHFTIQHEIAHSLGLDHPSQSSSDSMKYTIMSSQIVEGMNPIGTTNDVLPSGLQLLDIAALQTIYGINTSTRSGDTTYKEAQGFSDNVNDAFIYTIWDGAGSDTIDTSAYTDGVVINLNDGEFSSIGKSADSSFVSDRNGDGVTETGLAFENVAIAYNAEIENAIGTIQADTFIGNELDNTLTGNAGDDTYIFNVGGGSDTIIDNDGTTDVIKLGAGIDIDDVSFTRSGDDLTIELQGADQITIKDQASGANSDQVEFLEFDNGDRYLIRIAHYDPSNGPDGSTVTGTNEDDFVIGSDANEQLNGRRGDDRLYGGAGNDNINTGSGNDVVFGGDGFDIVQYNVGRAGSVGTQAVTVNLETGIVSNDSYGFTDILHSVEHVIGTSFNDHITGSTADERLEGWLGNDTIFGGAGDDDIWGNSGTNQLHGGAGDDTFIGGSGIDTVVYDDNLADYDVTPFGPSYLITHLIGTDGLDLINQNIERIQFADGVIENGAFTQNSNPATVNGDILLGTVFHDQLDGLAGNDTLRGDVGNDTVNGDEGDDILYGDEGDDTINGGDGADEIYGEDKFNTLTGAGNDTINAGAGADVVVAGYGDDVVNGDAGADILYGWTGNDTVRGGSENDIIYGDDKFSAVGFVDAGDDVLYGDAGADTLAGGDGNDTLYGGDDNDKLYGTGGDDTLYGDAGVDLLYGGEGSDTLRGGTGNDTLLGENGNDVLYAEEGLDSLWGQGGVDTYAFEGESAFDVRDRIRDFEAGETIDISDVLSDFGYVDGVDVLADWVTITNDTAHSYVAVDRDGTGSTYAASQIVFTENYNTLTVSDLVTV
ncbi:M10 family metallopeptidase C-terminal domain-containing protein [Kordiimonas aquimaris]|uniref:M10 family metallopeptidase C-terminal domain-containing protein n=1 Tax=Kordiimonas aquimaris TaxID=707591 RepID=UPI0021CF3B6A|nr:M10 family metallopeptidase C-terminal domain-containing protein [Kordiimonas aquimaris]